MCNLQWYGCQLAPALASYPTPFFHACLADGRDSLYLLALVEATQQRLRRWGLRLHNVVADAGYGSGENYAQLESRGLMGYIPPHGGYKEQRPGFTYDVHTDSYVYSQGKRLAFDRRIVDRQGNAKNRYMAHRTDCRKYPVNVACKGKSPQENGCTTRSAKPAMSACSAA